MAGRESSAARKPEEQALVITRVFDAPPVLVFKAWTEPERMMHWWGPKGFTLPVCRIDLRPGGTYHYCMRSPEGKDYWGQGTYLEIEEPKRIVCTDTFADENGDPVSPRDYGMSSDWPEEAMIVVHFAERDGWTRLTLHHSPIMPGPDRDMCEQGWNESLDRLEEYLAKA